MILIRKAILGDFPIIKAILKQSDIKEDKADELRGIMVLEVDSKLVGVGKVDILEDIGFIDYIVIIKEYRNQSLADGLIRALINYSDRRGVRKLLIKTKKPDFFTKIGFKVVDTNNLSLDIIKTKLQKGDLLALDIFEFFNNHQCCHNSKI